MTSYLKSTNGLFCRWRIFRSCILSWFGNSNFLHGSGFHQWFRIVGDHGGHVLNGFAFLESHEFNTLGIAAGFANVANADAHALAFGGHEHELVFVMHCFGSDDLAGLLRDIHRGHTFAATIGEEAVLVERRALAETVLGYHQHHGIGLIGEATDEEIAVIERDATYASSVTTDRTQGG